MLTMQELSCVHYVDDEDGDGATYTNGTIILATRCEPYKFTVSAHNLQTNRNWYAELDIEIDPDNSEKIDVLMCRLLDPNDKLWR